MTFHDGIEIDASMTIDVEVETDPDWPPRDVERSPEAPEGGTIAQSQ